MSRIYKILQHVQPNFKPQLFPSNHLFQTQTCHAHILKLGITGIQSSLIISYCESKQFSNALQVFDETPHWDWDLVSITSTIGHFARQGGHSEAIRLFARMLELDIRPNEFTFGTVIHSSISLEDVHLGEQLHAFTTKMGLRSNVFVGSSLLDLYSKLRNVEEGRKAFEDTQERNVVSYTTLIHGYLKNERFEDALEVFREMPERNVVSWNALISGCSQMGRTEEAINLFVDMIREGLRPSESTFPCVFSAAGNIAALGMGKSLHACALKNLGKYDVFVGNALISFYAKCGNMEDSLLVFDQLRKRNIVSCNAVINGYAHNGRGKEALKFYHEMQVSGVRPNSVTLLCVLSACNHAGLVDEGQLCFNQARSEHPSIVMPEHFSCVVDMLSRSGRFVEAKRLLEELPFNPGIGFWKSLLGGCLIHSNAELAELAARKIHALDPTDVSSYIMLSNSNSVAGRWQSVSLIRKEMREKGLKRTPGCSWIEINAKVHVFATGDKRHCRIDEICKVLGSCYEHFRENPASNIL